MARAEKIDLDITSKSEGDGGPAERDLPMYRMPQGIMTLKRMRELVSRYRIPPKYVCKLPSDDDCISYSGLTEVFIRKHFKQGLSSSSPIP